MRFWLTRELGRNWLAKQSKFCLAAATVFAFCALVLVYGCSRDRGDGLEIKAAIADYNSNPSESNAARVLGYGDAAINGVVDALAEAQDGSKAGLLTVLLARFGTDRTPEPVLDLSHSSRADSRAKAALALNGYRDALARDALVELLEDDATEVRRRAAIALKRWTGSAEVVSSLETRLADVSGWVRLAAAGSLAPTRSEKALPVLLDAADSESAFARLQAAAGLGSFSDTRARDALKRLADDRDADVRETASFSLRGE